MVRETQRDKVHIVYAVMVHEDTHIYNTWEEWYYTSSECSFILSIVCTNKCMKVINHMCASMEDIASLQGNNKQTIKDRKDLKIGYLFIQTTVQ